MGFTRPACVRPPPDLGQLRYDKGAAEHPPLPTRPAPRQGRTTLTIAVREILLRQNPFDPTSACPLSDYASKETEPMAGDWGGWLPSAGYGCSPRLANNRRDHFCSQCRFVCVSPCVLWLSSEERRVGKK